MKKGAKIAAIGCSSVVGLLAVGALAFWWFVARPPSPDDLCDHIVAVMTKEAEDLGKSVPEEAISKLREECVKNAKPGEYENSFQYAQRAKCELEAESMKALKECEERRY